MGCVLHHHIAAVLNFVTVEGNAASTQPTVFKFPSLGGTRFRIGLPLFQMPSVRRNALRCGQNGRHRRVNAGLDHGSDRLLGSIRLTSTFGHMFPIALQIKSGSWHSDYCINSILTIFIAIHLRCHHHHHHHQKQSVIPIGSNKY